MKVDEIALLAFIGSPVFSTTINLIKSMNPVNTAYDTYLRRFRIASRQHSNRPRLARNKFELACTRYSEIQVSFFFEADYEDLQVLKRILCLDVQDTA